MSFPGALEKFPGGVLGFTKVCEMLPGTQGDLHGISRHFRGVSWDFMRYQRTSRGFKRISDRVNMGLKAFHGVLLVFMRLKWF